MDAPSARLRSSLPMTRTSFFAAFWIAFICLISGFAEPLEAVSVNVDQQEVLQNVKESLGAIDDSLFASWFPANECGKWLGVTCDDAGNVVSLVLTTLPIPFEDGTEMNPTIDASAYKGDFYGNVLNGTLSEEITKLTSLTTLALRGSTVTGRIPRDIGNLTNLEFLDLSRNILFGELPASIASLTRLTYLSLAANQYFDKDDVLQSAFNGTVSMEALTSLEYLDLSENNFTGSPQLKNLTNLKYLSLRYNQFSGKFCDFMGDFPNLAYLTLDSNPFDEETIPPFFGNYTALTYLNLGSLNLSGSIPEEFSQLSKIDSLILSNNNLDGDLSQTFINWEVITSLSIAGNRFTGEFPKVIGNLSSLLMLELQLNEFNGTIPSNLNLEELTDLDISQNKFSGGLENIAQLKKLRNLNMDENAFGAQFPVSITALTELQMWSCRGCGLQGNLSSEITKLENLIYLDLAGNGLEGEIPSNLKALEFLQLLDLSENEFSGEIPADIGELPSINELRLQGNNLVGAIPASIIESDTLTLLWLQDNNLDGVISKWPKSVTDLDLSNNNLVGRLPKADGKLQFESLNLANNFLTGSPKLRFASSAGRPSVLLNDNFFSKLDVDAKAIDLAAAYNCLPPSARLGVQRPAADCARFCDALQAGGACGQFGVCVPTAEGFDCKCEDGYKSASSTKPCKLIKKNSVEVSIRRMSPPPANK